MGFNSGKFFDAKLSREKFDEMRESAGRYFGYADGTHGSYNSFNNNQLFLGVMAAAAKMFICQGMAKSLVAVTDMNDQMVKDQDYIMSSFEGMVDSSPAARIEYNTLDIINKDFKGYNKVYNQIPPVVRSIVNHLNSEFGDYASFPQPDPKQAETSFIDICGGESGAGGYFNECIDKFLEFDYEMTRYLNGKDTMDYRSRLEKNMVEMGEILTATEEMPPLPENTDMELIPHVEGLHNVQDNFKNLCDGIETVLKGNLSASQFLTNGAAAVDAFREGGKDCLISMLSGAVIAPALAGGAFVGAAVKELFPQGAGDTVIDVKTIAGSKGKAITNFWNKITSEGGKHGDTLDSLKLYQGAGHDTFSALTQASLFKGQPIVSPVMFPVTGPTMPLDPETTAHIAEQVLHSISSAVNSIQGFIPHNCSNEEVVITLATLAGINNISNSTISQHWSNNTTEIGDVYESGQYIENQSQWGDVLYGDADMAYSGCEILSIVNAMHSMGVDMTEEEVADLISYFEKDGAVRDGKWGTSPLALVEYLRENTNYVVNYTTTSDYAEIEEFGKNSDTIIVTLYNNEDNIMDAVHTINIEKRTDANGNVVYVGHNTYYYSDQNGNGVADDGEWIESKEYDTLEEAITDSSHQNNAQTIMVIGLNEPIMGDFEYPENGPIPC